MSSRKLIACNHLGNGYIREMAKAYVFWPNGGSYHQSLYIYVRTRGGRYAKKWENIRNLINFRAVSAFINIGLDKHLVDYDSSEADKVVGVLNEALIYWNQRELDRIVKEEIK